MARGKKSRKNSANEAPPPSDDVNEEIKRKIIGNRIKSYREGSRHFAGSQLPGSSENPEKDYDLFGQKICLSEEKKPGNNHRRFEIIRWKHREHDNDADIVDSIRTFLSFLPSQFIQGQKYPYDPESEMLAPCPMLDSILSGEEPDDYDIRSIIGGISDDEGFFEASPDNDPESDLTLCFAKITGVTVGIIADKSLLVFGGPCTESQHKASKFTRFCSTFNIPVIIISESPCFIPGNGTGWDESIREGTKLLWHFSAASSPKIFVLTRTKPGSDGIFCSPEQLGADAVFVWSPEQVEGRKEKHRMSGARNESGQTLTTKIKLGSAMDCGPSFPGLKASWMARSEEIRILPSETRIMIAGFLHRILGKKAVWSEGNKGTDEKASGKGLDPRTMTIH